MKITNSSIGKTTLAFLFALTCSYLSAQTITSRTQINTFVPTVYIDILDGEKVNDELVSTKDANGNKVFRFKTTSGEFVDISDAIIAENPEIIANASSERWTNYYKSQWTPKQETYDLAVITIIDESGSIKPRHELTTIRGRGNSTWWSQKRAFRLKFPSKTKLLAAADGTNEYANSKSWTLIANAIDKSLIRNALATEIGKYVGMPYNAAYKFVDLVINGEYWGSYHIGDHIQVDPDRVNIDSKEGWFMEMVYGNSFEEAPLIHANLSSDITNVSINIKNPEVDNDDSNDPAITAIANWFNNTLAPTMNQYAVDVHSEENGMRTYVDIETLIDYVITSELTGNYDACISNYLYKDKNDTKIKFGPIWDNDLSFGNYGETQNKHIYNTGKADWAPFGMLVQKFFGDAVFMKAYKRKWDKLFANNNIVSFINEKVSNISSSISCSWEDNSTRWPLNEQLISWGGLTYDNNTTYSTVLKDITDYVSTHTSWLNTEYSSWYNDMKSSSSYTLDAESTNTSSTPFSEYSNKITPTSVINRSFVANEWQAICLPFDLDEDELKGTFGTGVELAEYTLLNGTAMTFTPQDKLALHAGVPYLIKPLQTVENPDFDDVVLSIQQPKTIKLSETDEISFVGTFFKTTTGGVSIINNGAVTENTTDNVIGVSAYIVKPAGTEVTINILGKEVAELSIDMTATDNATTLIDKLGGTYNITLANRGNLYADGWCTICLPFTITKKDFEGKIGYDTKLRELSAINGSSFEFGKVDDKTMKAGVPYLIMIDNTDTSITKDLGSVSFSNIKLEAIEGTSVSPKEGYAFVGILQATDLKTDGTDLFLGGTGDKLLIPIPSDKTLSGGKAYFQVPSKEIGTNAKVNIDGVETSVIETLHNVILLDTDNKVYNLNGQMVGTDIENMPKGIYIYKGKKIIK